MRIEFFINEMLEKLGSIETKIYNVDTQLDKMGQKEV